MLEKQACITIPVYKQQPASDEIRSLSQCFSVLKAHPMYLVTFRELDISVYQNLAAKAGVSLVPVYFRRSFFKSIHGYNRLMKSLSFYTAFKQYAYLLIYQPDAWVFSDQLDYWCSQNYDYIGAPWNRGTQSPETGNPLEISGNGGFSLRRTSYFINLLGSHSPVFTKQGISEQIHKSLTKKITLKNIVKTIGYKTGILNTIRFITFSRRTEDWFWIDNFVHCSTNFPMNVPQPETALRFAFEQWPSYLYKKNNNQLPFGAHAWRRFEYDSFWKQFLEVPHES